MPPKLPELVKRARRLATERDRLVQELAREWTTALRGQGFAPRDLEELWAGLTGEAGRRLAPARAPRPRGARGGAHGRGGAPAASIRRPGRGRRGDPARGARGHRPRPRARGDRACPGGIRRRRSCGRFPAWMPWSRAWSVTRRWQVFPAGA